MVMQNIHMTPLEMIEANPFQERAMPQPVDVDDLAKSIEHDGLMQYPVGRLMPDGESVQLAFGHRRWVAFQLLNTLGKAGFDELPVILRDLTDEQMAIFAFQENEKRLDINPIERARLIQHFLVDFGYTQEEAGAKIGLDRSTVANTQRLLRLPAEMIKAIESGVLPQRSAMALMPYFELGPAELAILETKVPEHADFAALARSGELSSDTIRKTVDTYLGIVAPKEEAVSKEEEPELFSDASVETVQEIQSDGNDFQMLTPIVIHNDDDGAQDQIIAESDEEDLPDGAENQEAPAPAKKPAPVSTSPVKPAPAPAPAAPQPALKPAEQTTLNIVWDLNGRVTISFRRAGELIPRFIDRESLKAVEMIALAEELGIE